MKQDRRRKVNVYINKIYRHFKGDRYLVLTVSEPCPSIKKIDIYDQVRFKAFHTETEKYITITESGARHEGSDETLVIYMGLCGDKRGVIYARPIEMFTSLVDKDKYPYAKQEYRFEPVLTRKFVYDMDKDTLETMGMRYRLIELCRRHYGTDYLNDPYRGIQCLSCPLSNNFCQQEHRRPLYSNGQEYVMNVHTETIKKCLEVMQNRRK